MDQSVNEPQPLNIDQVSEHIYFIKREYTDDEGDQLPNVPPDNGHQGPSCGESQDDEEQEEDGGAGHLDSHQHAEESDGRMSSVSLETARPPSRVFAHSSGVTDQVNSITSQLIKREHPEETVSIQLPINLSVHNRQAFLPHSRNATEDESYSSDLNDNRHDRDREEQQQQQQMQPPNNVATNDNGPICPLPNVPQDNGDQGPSIGESNDDEQEEDDGAGHLNSHQHAEECYGRMSSVSIVTAHVPSQDIDVVNGQINSITSQLINSQVPEETESIQLPVNLSVHNRQAFLPHSRNATEDESYSSDLNDNRHNRDGEEQQQPQANVATNDNRSDCPLPNVPQGNGDQRPVSVQLPVNLSVHNSHHQALPSHSLNANVNESYSSDLNDNQHDRDGEEQQQVQPRADAPTNDNRSDCPFPNVPQCPSGSRVLAPLAPPSTFSSHVAPVNQPPVHARANLPSSIPPSLPQRIPSRGVPQPDHDTVTIHGGVSGQLVGRCLTNSSFKMGDIVRENCSLVGTFTIDYFGGYNGTFLGKEVTWAKREISGTIYDGKFKGIFDGDVQRANAHENVFYGKFGGTLTGRFVGTLDGVSNGASRNAAINVKDEEDDKGRVKSKIEVIQLDDDNDVEDVDDDEVQFIEPPVNAHSNEQPNHGELDFTSNEDAHHQIPNESGDRDVNFDNVDAYANHEADHQIRNDNVVEDDDFDDDDVDDIQSNVSTDSSVASEDETTSNNPDSQDQQQQPQLRKSLRIVELEQRAALKRTQQQELPEEVENIVPEVKRSKTEELDKNQSRKTMSVNCSDCPASFDTFAKMYAHKLTEHQVERYLCFADGCTQSFANTKRLSDHSAANHPKGTTQFACRNCSKKFGTQTTAKEHFNKCGTKGVFVCTCCSCYTKMISLTTAHDHLDPHKNTSAYCTETAQCGKTYSSKRALGMHKSERHRPYRHPTLRRCKLCDNLCTFNSKTMIKHFCSEHSVSAKNQIMKCLEHNTEIMTKEQVDLEIKKLVKQGKSNLPLVPALDLFGPSTSGTQRRPIHSFDNHFDDDDDDDDNDEGAYYRAIPSTSQQQPSYSQGNQFRHTKCLVRDLTKE